MTSPGNETIDRSNSKASRIYRGRVDASGRVLLPAELRGAMQVGEGDSVFFVQREGAVELRTQSQAVQRAQEFFCALAPRRISLVNELLTERRAEAARGESEPV